MGQFKEWMKQYDEIWPAFAIALGKRLGQEDKNKRRTSSGGGGKSRCPCLKDGTPIEIMSRDRKAGTVSGTAGGKYVTVPFDEIIW